MLQESSPQIFKPSIVSYHNFLPKHIHFQSKMLSDEGVYKMIMDYVLTTQYTFRVYAAMKLYSSRSENQSRHRYLQKYRIQVLVWVNPDLSYSTSSYVHTPHKNMLDPSPYFPDEVSSSSSTSTSDQTNRKRKHPRPLGYLSEARRSLRSRGAIRQSKIRSGAISTEPYTFERW